MSAISTQSLEGSTPPSKSDGNQAKSCDKGKKSKQPKIVLSRSEKDAFIAWLSTKFAETSFRSAFLQTKHLARARRLLARSAVVACFAKASRCLEHQATFADVVAKATAAARLSDADTKRVTDHWVFLNQVAKGSKKIVARRERADTMSTRGNVRSKHRKHQSRH